MENISNKKFMSYLTNLSEIFSKIRIPTYVIACGAQAENYNALDKLADKISELSKRFIDAVSGTGGEFALRGHFTKGFFKKLGFPSAVVIGCPSMYQFGKSFLSPVSCQNTAYFRDMAGSISRNHLLFHLMRKLLYGF